MTQSTELQTRNMVLALYYLTGTLNREQINYLIDLQEPVPDTWEKIVDQVETVKRVLSDD